MVLHQPRIGAAAHDRAFAVAVLIATAVVVAILVLSVVLGIGVPPPTYELVPDPAEPLLF